MDINNITSAVGNIAQVAPEQRGAKVFKDLPVEKKVNDRLNLNESVAKEEPEKLKDKEVQEAISEVNNFFQNEQRSLLFSINEATGDLVVQVKDSQTHEILRQIPPEYVVKLAEHLDDLNESMDSSGVLFKEQA